MANRTYTFRENDKVIKRIHATAPTQRADGAQLDIADIAGYRGYYRHETWLYGLDSAFIPVDSKLADETVLEDLRIVDLPDGSTGFDFEFDVATKPTGRYVYQFTTLDINGLESEKSDSITLEIFPLAPPYPPEVS